MSDAAKPFAFSQFVPGFDFLKNLTAAGGGTGTGSAMPGLSNWVAPTLSVEEVDKRIQELKTVQFWLEQNSLALKATIQALEVQKMTLSTLRGMNVRMEDIASAFTRAAQPPAASAPAAAPAPSPSAASFFSRMPAAAPAPAPVSEPPAVPQSDANTDSSSAATDAPADVTDTGQSASAGVVDPMQWWGSLTEQFQQIASSALKDAAQLKMPEAAQPFTDVVNSVIGAQKKSGAESAKAKRAAPTKSATAKRPAAKKAAAKKSTSAARKR